MSMFKVPIPSRDVRSRLAPIVELVGFKQMKHNLDLLVNEGGLTYKGIVLAGLTAIEINSTNRTPVDTGYLRSKGIGRAKITKFDKDGAEGKTFNETPYATVVHEKSIPHRIGEWKFLEKAVKDIAPRVEKMFGVKLKTKLFTKDMA